MASFYVLTLLPLVVESIIAIITSDNGNLGFLNFQNWVLTFWLTLLWIGNLQLGMTWKTKVQIDIQIGAQHDICTTNEDSSSHSILALVPASWLDLTPSQNNCVRSSSSNKMCEIFIFFSVWWNSQSKELNKFQRWVGTCLFWLVRIRSELGLREIIVGVWSDETHLLLLISLGFVDCLSCSEQQSVKRGSWHCFWTARYLDTY